MSKKYLSIEEAAQQVGVSTSELNRMREKGLIRAFADRGTWKFKEDDVETLVRSRQADSNPEVPLAAPDDEPSDEDSSVMDDEDVLGSQPTVIRKGSGEDSSDSDVRLIFDDSMKVEDSGRAPLSDASDSDVKLAPAPLDDSDSDVKLAPAAAEDSDSDVKLAGTKPGDSEDSDSDVKLAGAKPGSADTGSDSDVKLVADDMSSSDASRSDSDVRLVSSDSSGEVKMSGKNLNTPLASDDDRTIDVDLADGNVLGDSGISLGEGSGLALAGDSGISLEQPNDSGISLAEGSSLLLGGDSGISLAGDVPLKGDSGISLAQPPSDKKKKKKEMTQADDDLAGTVPLMDAPLAENEDLLDTQMEVPNLSDSAESGDLFGGSDADTTNVITLDDEEDAQYDVTADIPTGGGAALDEEEEAVSVEDEQEEPVEIADDLVGEDDELTEDVFGAEDEDFAGDDVESGESSAELPISPRGMVAVAEQDWGGAVHAVLVISTVLTLVCGTLLFDMVRNMWHTDAANHNPLASMLLDMFKNI